MIVMSLGGVGMYWYKEKKKKKMMMMIKCLSFSPLNLDPSLLSSQGMASRQTKEVEESEVLVVVDEAGRFSTPASWSCSCF